MSERPPNRWGEALTDAARAALVAGLCWMGVDMAAAQGAPSTVNAAALYQQHCAACHGEQRTGLMGPALLPESLERLRPAEALKVIQNGRPATQMPGFAQQLSVDEVNALAAYVRTPVLPAPRWTEADIRASRTFNEAPKAEPAKPLWSDAASLLRLICS